MRRLASGRTGPSHEPKHPISFASRSRLVRPVARRRRVRLAAWPIIRLGLLPDRCAERMRNDQGHFQSREGLIRQTNYFAGPSLFIGCNLSCKPSPRLTRRGTSILSASPTPRKAYEGQRWYYFNLYFFGSQSKKALAEKLLFGAEWEVFIGPNGWTGRDLHFVAGICSGFCGAWPAGGGAGRAGVIAGWATEMAAWADAVDGDADQAGADASQAVAGFDRLFSG